MPAYRKVTSSLVSVCSAEVRKRAKKMLAEEVEERVVEKSNVQKIVFQFSLFDLHLKIKASTSKAAVVK